MAGKVDASRSQRHHTSGLARHTFDGSGLISGDDPQSFAGDDDPATDPTRDRDARGRALEDVRDRETQGCTEVTCRWVQCIYTLGSAVARSFSGQEIMLT